MLSKPAAIMLYNQTRDAQQMCDTCLSPAHCLPLQAHYLLGKPQTEALVKLRVMNAKETGFVFKADTACTIVSLDAAQALGYEKWGGAEGLAAEIAVRKARSQASYDQKLAERKQIGYQPGQKNISEPRVLKLDSETNFVHANQKSGHLGGSKYGHPTLGGMGAGLMNMFFMGGLHFGEYSDEEHYYGDY